MASHKKYKCPICLEIILSNSRSGHKCLHNKNVKRHIKNFEYKYELSKSTKYRKLNSLKNELNTRVFKGKEQAITVFGENEVRKLITDCNGSTREILKVIKWMRKCYG